MQTRFIEDHRLIKAGSLIEDHKIFNNHDYTNAKYLNVIFVCRLIKDHIIINNHDCTNAKYLNIIFV